MASAAAASAPIKTEPLPQPTDHLSTQTPSGLSIWESDFGAGFRSDLQSVGIVVSATYGLAEGGSHQAHHLAAIGVSYGNMLGATRGEGRWYCGNWEFRADLFYGLQHAPETEWFAGLTPHLRYNFATGTRWIPFIDAGIGVTFTEIGAPDLGGDFQFNEQAGLGMHCFIKPDVALTAEVYFVHWSNGGTREPNCGLNGISARIGLNLFF